MSHAFQRASILVLLACWAVAAQELIPADGSTWKPFAPRAQNAPQADAIPSSSAQGYRLKLTSGGKRFAYGG